MQKFIIRSSIKESYGSASANGNLFFKGIQPKLTINQPNDVYEQEADAMADKVMRMEQPFVAPIKESSSQNQSLNTATASFIQRLPASAAGFGQQQPVSVVTPQIRYRPTGIISRSEFDSYLQTYYGIRNIHTGTQQEQEQRITRHGVPAPTIPSWQPWDPGSTSEDYTSIINGMEEMINALGAMPQIQTIIFFQKEYEPDPVSGIGIAHPDTGASFGAGEMVIYEVFSGTTNPAAGISTSHGTPARTRDRSGSISDTIIHELGHGVGEAGSNNSAQMFTEYNAAAGWIGSPAVLYDMGQPEVRAAIANGTAMLPQHIITPSRWNDATVSEQPMSRYAVAGGPGEDFAESIAAYINNPSVLRQRSPWRYQFINTNMADWVTRMRSMSPGVIRPPLGDFPMPDGETLMA